MTNKELITDEKLTVHKESRPESQKTVIKTCYVPVINNNPDYKVRLMDSQGKYQKYIRTNTTWKVWNTKTIRGMKCYKIGTDEQWLPAKFAKMV